MTRLDYLIDLTVNAEDKDLLALSETSGDHTFSESYNSNMQKLFKKKRLRKLPARWRYAAASIIIVATLAGAATAGAFWSEITAFFQTIYSQYANFNLTPSQSPRPPINDDVLNSWDGYWFPGYMVENYEFDHAAGKGNAKQITFTTDQGLSIQFKQTAATSTLESDIEGIRIYDILINDFNAFAFKKDIGNLTIYTLVWSDGTTSFYLIGQVSLEELIDIAENIAYVEISLED